MAVALLVGGSGVLGQVLHASAAGAVPDGDGPASSMQLVFADSFEGSSLDASVWATCYPWFHDPAAGCTNFGNADEKEWYLPSGDQVSGGILHLVADEQPTEGTTRSGAPRSYPYSSGMLTTYRSFSFTYGYVDVVARLPGGAGTWPALWLLPTSWAWPPEIDIMENWGPHHAIRTTFHWRSAAGPECAGRWVSSAADLASGWHSYGLLWRPGSLVWYLDGRVVDAYVGPNVPSVPMYFLADLAISGAAAPHSSFDLRSVRIYQSGPGISRPEMVRAPSSVAGH